MKLPRSVLRLCFLFVFQAATTFSAIVPIITPTEILPATPSATNLQATYYDAYLPDSDLLLHTAQRRLAQPLFLPALRSLILRGRDKIIEQGRMHGADSPVRNPIIVANEGLAFAYYPSLDPGLNPKYRAALATLEGVETAVTHLGFKEVDWFLYAMDTRKTYRRGNAAHGYLYHVGVGADAAMLNVTALGGSNLK
ncbi:MAG: hypothetical protein LQ351_007423 [Letrouitia transgressa]|nr:MAG: hypothetical protein LQ351_007423 [Letrouitia transgressa]